MMDVWWVVVAYRYFLSRPSTTLTHGSQLRVHIVRIGAIVPVERARAVAYIRSVYRVPGLVFRRGL